LLVGTPHASPRGVGRVSTTYRRRHPAQSVLYQIVRDHYATFRAQAASLRGGEGLPQFIDEEFRGFLRCGWLAGGSLGFSVRVAVLIDSFRSRVVWSWNLSGVPALPTV
jgi:hypothetical protein